MAGVIVGTMLTPISLQSIVGQAFNGVDSEALMAIPFFLLVGELMTSANVVVCIAELSQAWQVLCVKASPRHSGNSPRSSA
jgi:TRAP-type mannitol/chloroaromatic compound transport system permease large subunit